MNQTSCPHSVTIRVTHPGAPDDQVPGKQKGRTVKVTAAPGTWQPEDDWTLLVGQKIEIHEQGKILDCGRVEDVTKDGYVLWLEMDGPTCRRIIEKSPVRLVKVLCEAPVDESSRADRSILGEGVCLPVRPTDP
jgi:hypothetical protein